MNNKLGGMYVNNDERAHYTFNFTDTHDNKHVSVSFRAEPDYDLDIIFAEIRNFLIATNHDVEGPIGELNFDEGSYDDEDELTQNPTQDKFSMDNIPDNSWMFGQKVKAENWPTDAAAQYFSQQAMKHEQDWHNTWSSSNFSALTTADLAPLTVTDLTTLTSRTWTEWSAPTMAPLTQEQVQSWTLPSLDIKALTSADIAAWTTPMPGTIGGAKVKF